MNRIGFSLLALVSASSAFAQSGNISLGYEVFYPKDSALRNAFGSVWQGFSISPRTIGIREGLQTDFDITVLSKGRNGNDILLITPSVGISKTFNTGRGSSSVPFVAVRVGFTYADYDFGGNDRKRTVYNTNFEAGYVFNGTLRISARYDLTGSTDGVNFNGASFSASYRLFSF